MNKELIELQKGSKAVCAIVLEENYKTLGKVVSMKASINDEYLFGANYGNPIFKEQIEELSNNDDICYFVIKGITNLNEEDQNKYVGMIKDREINGYTLPDNVIIVFTVNSKEELKNISKEIYHFSVVAF